MNMMPARSAAFKFAADIIFPNRCAFCGNIIKWNALACGDCEKDLPLLGEEKINIRNSDGCFSGLRYEKEIPTLIKNMKNEKNANFAEYCAELVSEKIRSAGICEPATVVTAVPMNLLKRLKRGHNQAEIFAAYTADMLGLKTDFNLLKRSSDKTEQHSLKRAERRVHAETVYYLNPERRLESSVIICDDVITTGYTMEICCKLLKEMGAEKVYCISAAAAFLSL